MNTESPNDTFLQRSEVTIPNACGFHLRMVAQFVECTREFRSIFRVRLGRKVADGKSILGLLTLGATWNSKLEIEVAGEDANEAMMGIREFFFKQEVISVQNS